MKKSSKDFLPFEVIKQKKLEDAGCIKIKKKFEGNYPALFVLYIFQIINPINIYGIDIR